MLNPFSTYVVNVYVCSKCLQVYKLKFVPHCCKHFIPVLNKKAYKRQNNSGTEKKISLSKKHKIRKLLLGITDTYTYRRLTIVLYSPFWVRLYLVMSN